MNLSPSGFVGCSVTFAVHLVAAMFSRRPIVSFIATAVIGGTIALSVASIPEPPAPRTPAVPAFAYVK